MAIATTPKTVAPQFSSKEDILAALASGKINVDAATKLLTAIEPKKGNLYCKVSEKKAALSVYGLQRMPVTLYVGQWERLLDFADSLKTFIEAHREEFATKD